MWVGFQISTMCFKISPDPLLAQVRQLVLTELSDLKNSWPSSGIVSSSVHPQQSHSHSNNDNINNHCIMTCFLHPKVQNQTPKSLFR